MSKEQYLVACNIGANNETFPSPAITVATRIVRQVLVGKSSARTLKRNARLSLLQWCETKGVRSAVDRPVTCDLADIVNPIGFPENPAAV